LESELRGWKGKMSCEDELAGMQGTMETNRLYLMGYQAAINDIRAAVARLREQLAILNADASASIPAAITTPRPATPMQTEEQRGVGSGEDAQAASLLRDIEQMEGRLARLEAK
jgi:hypothetical protein